MALHVTGIGPLGADVRLPDNHIVHATVLAFRWDDTAPDDVVAYLARVNAGQPNELQWVGPDAIQRFKDRH